ncbi:serine-rich adhesin for platelets-like isoform X2 [Bombus pascuorum]|uniref:serine-rich adhesin for platelets-like isoform X2 n=1 Tax=Bombus pascuorum TaxID=65598 RepID=UPI002138D18D|nr:serine-rich adhesin for platelets-like isoform X2 [Bombus pascuorum]
MAAPQASSRLELLQARFQQKQLQEKEQKLLQLYDQQQQRAYQVVQRGSAGSNSSNHATSISQHTVTKTSSSSHTTSTSQGGKVRQMFDERRQTTVKGIDRSYPLEPLENKTRKQTNGNGVQKNGNSTVNRQSLTVKRVARADVNSNLNGGKPIVSYHEEISRESFGPCARQHQEDDEFGNENHVAQYANGNHRDETRMEEVLDEDMIERNRMMAKLHLMEYDETLKHRVKNDLESEEFPEDFMVDVPDKLPKQSVTRKLSQAEVRLERFKNANARRGNNVTKNPAIAPKKRSDPIFPAKSTCSGSRMTKTASDRRSNDGKNPASSKSRGKTVVSGNVGKTVSLDSGRNMGRRDENPRFFCGESEKSATAHVVGSKTARKLSPDLSEDRIRRSGRSAIFNKEKSAIKYPIDSKAARTSTSESLKDKTGKRESRELFSKDAGKSTITSATGATTARKLSSGALRDAKDEGDRGKFIGEESETSATTYGIRPKSAERPIREVYEDTKDVKRRSESPKFFCKESEKSATTYAIDSKTAEKYTREATKDTRGLKRRSESPKFFCKESEKSATTYAIDGETNKRFSLGGLKDAKKRSDSPKPRTYVIEPKPAERPIREVSEATKDIKRRSESPKFFCKESEKSATTYTIDSKTAEKYTREATKDTRDLKQRSESPKFFCKESEKSATTYAINGEINKRFSLGGLKDVKKRSDSPKPTTYAIEPKSAERLIREVSEDIKNVKQRSESPEFFCKESETSGSTYATDSKLAGKLARVSLKDIKDVKRRSESPRFFCKESERSATTYAIDAGTNKRFSFEYLEDFKQRSNSPKSTTYAIDSKRAERSIREPSEDIKDVKRRSESPRFFCEGSERSAKTYAIDRKAANSSKTRTPRSDSPKFFCKESEKSATTYAMDSTTLPTSPNYMKDSKSSVLKIVSKNKKNMTNNTIRESTNDAMKRHATYAKRDTISKSSSPKGPKYDVISCAKPKYQTLPKSTETKLPDVFERLTRERSSSPRSFCREGRRSATTMSIRNRDTESAPVSANMVQEMIKKGSKSQRVDSGKRDAPIIRANESKSPDFAKASSRSCSVSPQYFGSDSDRSASILMVTPETIVKTKPDLACCKEREQSPTSYVAKGEKLVTNVPREATRGSSSESYDETAKRFIRSSVSRFFSEQCEAAARNVEPRKLQLTDARTPNQTKSQFDDEQAENDERTSDSSPRSREIVESREETPEFLRYETEESAIATSLKSKTCTDVEQPPKGAHSLKQTLAREMTARPRNLSSNVKDRSSKIPLSIKDDHLTAENANALSRRGSAGVLRSTKLIRDVLQRQSGQDQVDYAPHGASSEWEERPEADRTQAEVRVDRKVEERAGTPVGRQLAAAGSESCKSAEVDTQIGEIRTPERYVKQEQLRGTYSRSSKGTACEKSSVGKLLTYSVRKPVKQRGSLLESNIFQQSLGDRDSAHKKPTSSKRTTRIASPKKEPAACARSIQSRTKGNAANGKNESDILKTRSRTASLISASRGKTSSERVADKWNVDRYDASKRITRTSNESTARGSKGATDVADRSGETKISRTGARTAKKQSMVDERKKGNTSKQTEVLKSMQLVRSATGGSDFEQESRKMVGESVDGTDEQTETRKSCCPSTIDIRRSEAGLASIKELSKNYERTDSVESALRRFDSIGTEAESIRGTLERSVESIPKEIRRKSGGSIGRKADSKTISPKALDPANVNLLTKRTCASKATTVSRSSMAAAKGRQTETQETQRQKKLEKARDSIEISRIAIRSRSLSCKRKLFQHTDSSETGSVASRCSIDSLRTVERLSTTSNKKKTRDSVNTVSKRFEFSGSDETSTQTIEKTEMDETSTGVGRCSSTKQLRSIEDIRRSMEDESWDRETGQSSATSTIVGSAAKAASRSEPRRINVNDRAGNRKEICSSGRSVNVTASNDALGDAERSSVKCTMRFSRVAKSPSPETTKETGIRARRNVPASPSKSPDTVARRASNELKGQDTRSTKRPTTMKGTEPIGNRKTLTATSTTTKKSADVVDSAILENGLHLRDQTAETKYDNDSPMKKSDALVVDLDEQPPKENDAPLPRKPLLRKQSTEKQITSMQSTRPPSGGSPMQSQTSGSRSKMASRAKTPISGSTGYKGSASSRTGGAAAATCYSDALVPCKMCGRRFAQDRVTLHEQICAKTTQKKRKQFDTMMYRVKGTDLEPFVKKGLVKKQVEKSKKPEIKSNWRRKHEDFINAIRSAKQVQAHLAAGGKLSDLPPPPVSDNYDYIQCPHCGRKFNKAAAERHIPKCEHMLHNKPIHSRAPKPRR